MASMKITKVVTRYKVETEELTADLRQIVSMCELKNNELVSVPGLSLFAPIRVKLGPLSMPKIISLKDGQSVKL